MDEGFIKAHGFGERGKYVLITVSDTGAGMDDTTQQKIFEPFFTTKEVGQGTGLGLSIVYGIIKQHNGFITVYSEKEHGTIFHLYLPAIQSEISKTEIRHAPVLQRGTETILVVEDDAQVREFSRVALENQGYRVIEAIDGEDGLRRFEEHKNDIDLLLLDVIMPKRNGREVYDEIIRLKPGIKAIFSSGYSGEVLAHKGVLHKDMNYLSKPLSPHDLLSKVRQVLDNNTDLVKEVP
jgi:CheY-like chemotaxis protein